MVGNKKSTDKILLAQFSKIFRKEHCFANSLKLRMNLRIKYKKGGVKKGAESFDTFQLLLNSVDHCIYRIY